MHRPIAATLAVALSVALLPAAPAAASGPGFGGPGFIGGHVEFAYSTTFGNDYSILLPNGSASFGFGNGVIAQLDGGMIGYSGTQEPLWHVAGHIGYQVNPALAVGAFLGRDWIGASSPDTFYGASVVYSGGFGSLPSMRTEAFYSRYDGRATIIDLRTEIPVTSSIDFLAGANYGNWGNMFYGFHVGARYNFDWGGYARAMLFQQIYYSGPDTQIALAVGYRFGSGATFGQRNFHHYFPGW